jgi:hypothetical protein
VRRMRGGEPVPPTGALTDERIIVFPQGDTLAGLIHPCSATGVFPLGTRSSVISLAASATRHAAVRLRRQRSVGPVASPQSLDAAVPEGRTARRGSSPLTSGKGLNMFRQVGFFLSIRVRENA